MTSAPMRVGLFIVVLLLCCATHAPSQPESAIDGPDLFVERLQRVLETSDAAAFRTLFASGATPEQIESLTESMVFPGVTRAIVRERDRAPLAGVPAGSGYRLILELFIEQGRHAGIFTYRIDLRRPDGTAAGGGERAWAITDQEVLTSVEGLFRLQLSRNKQFTIRNLTITAEDLVLSLPSGNAFVSETPGGVTGLVVMGPGEMRFTPEPAAERGQVRVFCGQDLLVTPFQTAFIRLNPGEFQDRVRQEGLVERAVDVRDLARAEEVFAEEVVKSFTLDLRELSHESWSLVPGYGDFLAEVRTRKYATLTYARSTGEREDITLFDRKRRRNVSVYASRNVRETRGFTYNEDDLADYDILDYDIEASFFPAREWIEGLARVKLRVRSYALATLTLKLNEALSVQRVVSDQHGRLTSIRVKDQNSLIVNLPKTASRDDVLELRISYSGRIPPQPPDREVIDAEGESAQVADMPIVSPEVRWVFSNRSYWYPQGAVTDFATARLRLSVPAPFASIASGSPIGPPEVVKGTRPGEPDRSIAEFLASQPLRYLSWMVTLIVPAAERTISVPGRSADGGSAAQDGQPLDVQGVRYGALDISVLANPRQATRGRAIASDVQDILGFYAGLLDDVPYPTFTLALVDNELPGGHSPAYFAMLYQPLPTTPYVWRNDPVFFDNFPQFFLAHELAHQYWGQAVGWKSYHEQWISEAFAQYFAALYAEKRSTTLFRDLLRRMRRTVLDKEAEGPIALGYRLGHIEGDSRVFRAILYNKGALVLHMLRRLTGDAAFFKGLRQLYTSSRFTKIGTDEVRQTFETVSGQSLEAFFARWMYDAALPTIRWSYGVEAGAGGAGAAARTLADGDGPARQVGGSAGSVHLTFTQVGQGEPFAVPVTVSLAYADGSVDIVMVPVIEASTETRLPLRGPLRAVEVNADASALARFEKR